MKKITELPAWYDKAISLTERNTDFVVAHTGVMIEDGRYFFTGALEEFLKARKIPRRVEFALDMESFEARVRLSFEDNARDGKNAAGHWRVVYTMLEPESFAHLWNAEVDEIHGLKSDQISLYLYKTEDSYPVLLGNGVQGNLIYLDGRFYGSPEDEEIQKEAA